MYLKIGIDLSTTNTGIVILDNNNKFLYKHNLLFKKFNDENKKYNFKLINNFCKDFYNEFLKAGKTKKIIIGVELANFSNASLTNKFNQYFGGFFSNFCEWDEIDVEVKSFHANEWMRFVPNIKVGVSNRGVVKQATRMFCSKKCEVYEDWWSEDVCDAYGIAYFLEQARSQEVIFNEKKVEKRKYKDFQKQELQVKNKILSLYKQLDKLDKEKNKVKIRNIKKELECLESIKNELKKNY